MRALFADPAFAVVPGSRRRAVLRAVPVLVRFRVPLVMLQAIVSPVAAGRRVARLDARAAAATPSPPDATGAQRLDRATEALRTALPVFPGSAPAFAAGFLMRAVARRLAGDDLDDVTMDAVLRALPHNVTTEMDLQLWALAQQARSDPPSAAALRADERVDLPPVLRDGLDAFLRRYGHRAVAEIDVGMPRWSERPEHVLGVLANYLRLDDPATAPDVRFAAGERVAAQTVAEVIARVRRRSRWRARTVGFALGRVRELVELREAPKDHLVRLVALARSELLAIGAELTGRGLLDARDDVFLLDLRKARSALGGTDHRAAVAGRRAEYARELRRRHVPRVLLSDGTEPEALAAAGPVRTAPWSAPRPRPAP